MTQNRVLQETLLSTLHHLSSRQHSQNGGQWLAISYSHHIEVIDVTLTVQDDTKL